MAERLKSKFLEEEKLVDIVVGPDAYRDLPKLVADAEDGERGGHEGGHQLARSAGVPVAVL